MTGVKSPVYCVIGIIVKVNAVRIFEFCKAAESAGKKPGVRKPGLNKRLGSGVSQEGSCSNSSEFRSAGFSRHLSLI
jgi:hypothetical protein